MTLDTSLTAFMFLSKKRYKEKPLHNEMRVKFILASLIICDHV